MPIVRIELFPGRDHATKMEIATGITRVLEETAGISPAATTVIFTEVSPSEWVVGGRPFATPAAADEG